MTKLKAILRTTIRRAGWPVLVVVLLALTGVVLFSSGTPSYSAPTIAIEGLELNQNFPNPFNNRTEIGYTIPTPGRVLLRVFNTLGQEVRVLVDETEIAGHYTARFDATSYPSGQYTYTLFFTSGDDGSSSKLTKKMYLVR